METERDSSPPSDLGLALRQLVDAHLNVVTVDVNTLQELTAATQVPSYLYPFYLNASAQSSVFLCDPFVIKTHLNSTRSDFAHVHFFLK